MRWRAASALMATGVLALGACGGGDDGDADPTSTTAPPGPQVTVATLNVLHGLFCDYERTDWCNAPARLEIVFRLLEDAGCPDLVGLQEIGPRQEELVVQRLAELCDGEYTLSWGARPGPDRQMILTRLPIVEEGFLDLANLPWEAPWVRVRAEGGTVDFLTAHFASSSNNPPCDATNCPPVCPPGIETNECHALEVVDLFASTDEPATLTIVSGDLNARPASSTVGHLLDAGFVDAWLAAGNAECSTVGDAACTGASDEPDTPYIGMDTVAGLTYGSRIDYVLARAGEACAVSAESAGFADAPLDDPVDGLYWPSDHKGVRAVITCG